jgi:hypothetical protein
VEGEHRLRVPRGAAGFDQERYPRPQIEDIELGYRLRARGFRILLDPSIQGTHLKRWRLPGMIRGDVLDRGAPWMLLLLERKSVGPGTLNIGMAEKLLTGLAVAGLLLIPVGAVLRHVWLAALGGAFVVVVIAGNARLIHWFARVRGPWFTVGIIPLRLLYYVLNGAAVGIAMAQRLLGRRSRKGSAMGAQSDRSPAIGTPGRADRNEAATGPRAT